ncbi:TetR/AcrR family transcriptional regulator C-terminal domain-containing protein [Streptomyces sp. NPDC002643]
MPRTDTTGRPWRERVTAVAEENRALFERHPWAAAVSTVRPPLGPGQMAKYEHELSGLDGLGLSDIEMDDCLTHLLTFVQSCARATYGKQPMSAQPDHAPARRMNLYRRYFELVASGRKKIEVRSTPSCATWPPATTSSLLAARTNAWSASPATPPSRSARHCCSRGTPTPAPPEATADEHPPHLRPREGCLGCPCHRDRARNGLTPKATPHPAPPDAGWGTSRASCA